MKYSKVVKISQHSEKYTNLAKELAVELFDRELNIGIYVFEDLKCKYYGAYYSDYVRDRKGKVIGYKPLAIFLNIANLHYDEVRIIHTLKHELCHWACQQAGKPHKDGSVYFETELLRIGATSTHFSWDNIEAKLEYSVARQTAFATGQITRLGNTRFSFVKSKPTLGRKYVKAYEVYYDGVLIGRTEKWYYGQNVWRPIFLDGAREDNLHWAKRKSVAEVLLKEYRSQQEKQRA